MSTFFSPYSQNRQHLAQTPLQPPFEVQNIVKSLKKGAWASFTVKQEQIFKAVLEAEFSYKNYGDKDVLCQKFGMLYTNEGIIDAVSRSLNISRLAAAQALAQYMGVNRH